MLIGFIFNPCNTLIEKLLTAFFIAFKTTFIVFITTFIVSNTTF